MKHERIIETALAQRSLVPEYFTCGCCGDDLHRDDHMRGHFQEDHAEAVMAAHGSNVCIGCADDFDSDEPAPCPDCSGTSCTCDDAYDIMKEECA